MSNFIPAFNIRSAGVPDVPAAPGSFRYRADDEFELGHFTTAALMMHNSLWQPARTVGAEGIDLSGTTVVHSFLLSQPLDGSLTFQIVPVTWQPGATAPFTMTGVLNDVPLEGAGTFTLGIGPQRPQTHASQATFEFAPVPEPGTLALVATGLVAAGLAWRRRR